MTLRLPGYTAAIVELGRAGVTMPGGLLHVLELGAVLERRGDERGAHRVRRVAAIEPERAGIFPDHAIDRIRVHASALVAALAVVFERPKQDPLTLAACPQYRRCPVSAPAREMPCSRAARWHR